MSDATNGTSLNASDTVTLPSNLPTLQTLFADILQALHYDLLGLGRYFHITDTKGVDTISYDPTGSGKTSVVAAVVPDNDTTAKILGAFVGVKHH